MEKVQIRVLAADDQKLVRCGIRSYLSTPTRGVYYVVEEADTVEEAIGWVRETSFDVILMDFSTPDEKGALATRKILELNPTARVLALTMNQERSYVQRMIRAGAKGIVLKNIGPEGLREAIRRVMNGKTYFSQEVMSLDSQLLGRVTAASGGLTQREREVLRLIAGGLKDKEIANRLYVARGTVRKHRQHLREKLGVHNAVGLVNAAYQLGIAG